jgi:hypothetical protein
VWAFVVALCVLPLSASDFVAEELLLASWAGIDDGSAAYSGLLCEAIAEYWFGANGYPLFWRDRTGDGRVDERDVEELAGQHGVELESVGAFDPAEGIDDCWLLGSVVWYFGQAYPDAFRVKVYDDTIEQENLQVKGYALPLQEYADQGVEVELHGNASRHDYVSDLRQGAAVIVGLGEEGGCNTYFVGRSFDDDPQGSTWPVDLVDTTDDPFASGVQGTVLETFLRQGDTWWYLSYGGWQPLEFMLSILPAEERPGGETECGCPPDAVAYDRQDVDWGDHGNFLVEECVIHDAANGVDVYTWTLTNVDFNFSGSGRHLTCFEVPTNGNQELSSLASPGWLAAFGDPDEWQWYTDGDWSLGPGKSAWFSVTLDAPTTDVVVVGGACVDSLNPPYDSVPPIPFETTGPGPRAEEVRRTACRVTPTSISFGAVEVGASKPLTFTVENIGDTAFSGTIVLSGADCGDFSLNASSVSLGPSQQKTYSVTFAPFTEGTKTCTADIQGAAGDVCSDVQLSGSGWIEQVLEPGCNVSPSLLDFGTVEVGSSQLLSFTVKNTGATQLVGAVVLSGSDCASCFSIDMSTVNLAPGSQATYTVTFHPNSEGMKTCTADIQGQAGGICSDVTLQGWGEEPPQPGCSVSPGVLDFGTVLIGSSDSLTFTVTNTGNTTFSGSIVLAGSHCGEYGLDKSSINLGPGSWETYTVTFHPSSEGMKTCTADIQGQAGGICSDVTLQGWGEEPAIPDCGVRPTSIDFGDVLVGESDMESFVVQNTGNTQLTGTIVLTGSDCACCYSIDKSNVNLGPSDSETYTVTFGPNSPGYKTCTADIQGSAGAVCSDVNLGGTGVCVDLCITNFDVCWHSFDNEHFSVTITTSVKNQGGTTASNVWVGLEITDPCTVFVAPIWVSFGSLAPGQTRTEVTDVFYCFLGDCFSCLEALVEAEATCDQTDCWPGNNEASRLVTEGDRCR